jgi:hypothetical protein
LTVALAFTLAAAILALGPAPSVSAASEYPLTDFSVLGLDGVELKNGATVISGHFGANNAGAEVAIKAKAVVDPSSLVVGDTVSLGKNSAVTEVAANQITGPGTPTGVVTSPVALPLVDDLPATPTFTPGTDAVDVKKSEAVTLEPRTKDEQQRDHRANRQDVEQYAAHQVVIGAEHRRLDVR